MLKFYILKKGFEKNNFTVSCADASCLAVLPKRRNISIFIEAVSKPSIGFKVKAERGGQPQEYITYFEDWTPRSNAGFGPEGRS